MEPAGNTSKPGWYPDWSGKPAVIVAGGPSAFDCPIVYARHRCHVLVINNGFQLAPWADALYASDFDWWRLWQNPPTFPGLKIGRDLPPFLPWDVHAVNLVRTWDDRVIMEPGSIGAGSSSGFQALNLAAQFGAKRIVLVGYDMTLKHGSHWHGRHRAPLHNPTKSSIEEMRLSMERAAPQYQDLGVEVVNASAVSALTSYPKHAFMSALKRWEV